MKLQELLDKYNSSDSVKIREELEETITDLCEKFAKNAQTIASKYGKHYFGDSSDYSPKSGNWSFRDASESSVTLQYTDLWGYGGSCRENHTFLASKVDGFSAKEYEKSLIEQVEKELKQKISTAKYHLTQAENKLKKFKELCQQN